MKNYFVHETSIVDEKVKIGKNTKIWHFCHISSRAKIGKNCKIQGEVIIDYSHYWHITIGENVTIAPRVHILAHDASTKLHLGYTKIGKVDIGNNVFIGAGSVVTKNIDESGVYFGNPAKKHHGSTIIP